MFLSLAAARADPPVWISVPEETATLSGYVLNANTGEGLAGANVYFLDTRFGTATDIEGYFVLPSVPPGSMS